MENPIVSIIAITMLLKAAIKQVEDATKGDTLMETPNEDITALIERDPVSRASPPGGGPFNVDAALRLLSLLFWSYQT